MTAVIFDLDGTLVDSVPDMHMAMNRVLAERGHAPLPVDRLRGFVGHGVPVLVRRVMEAAGVPGHGFDDWHDGYMRCYGEGICVETRPYPGVPGALAALAAGGFRLGVCTNKPQGLTEALLDGLGLGACFGAVLGGDSSFGCKPDPAPLREVLSRLGGGPAVMVGDSAADIGAARAAGMPVILYTGGYAGPSLEETAADAAFGDWSRLPPRGRPAGRPSPGTRRRRLTAPGKAAKGKVRETVAGPCHLPVVHPQAGLPGSGAG